MYRATIWQLCCLSIIAAGLMTACGDLPQNEDPPVTCTAEAMLAKNPATGVCEWISTCDLGNWEPCATDFDCDELPVNACELDDRCAVQTQTVCVDCAFEGPGCGCFTEDICTPVDPPSVCGDLDEATCLQKPECSPAYGWIEGETSPCPPGDGHDSDALCADISGPSTWGFLGCFDDVPPTSCANLGEEACLTDPACEPVYSSMPCACDGGEGDRAPGEWDPCFDCGGQEFDHCTSAVPRTCGQAASPEDCESLMGCRWEFDDGIYPDPIPCDCPIDAPDCECAGGAPYFPGGYCVQDVPDTCWGIGDEFSCIDTPGCEWDYEDYQPDPEPVPCDCPEDDPSCGCAGLVAPGGYCHPGVPQGCGDYGDEFSCYSDPSCQWYYEGLDCVCPEGVPCDCLPVELGYCGDRIETCYDVYDEFSCSSNPECEWLPLDGTRPAPPCDPNDPDCGAFCDPADPGCGIPEPPPSDGICQPRQQFCEYFDSNTCSSDPSCQWVTVTDGDECMVDEFGNCVDFGQPAPPDECWGAWEDETGVCRGPADGIYPAYCCDGVVDAGYCEPRPSNTCGDFGDEFSCYSAGCNWAWESICDCDPNAPSCACPAFGVCVP